MATTATTASPTSADGLEARPARDDPERRRAGRRPGSSAGTHDAVVETASRTRETIAAMNSAPSVAENRHGDRRQESLAHALAHRRREARVLPPHLGQPAGRAESRRPPQRPRAIRRRPRRHRPRRRAATAATSGHALPGRRVGLGERVAAFRRRAHRPRPRRRWSRTASAVTSGDDGESRRPTRRAGRRRRGRR